MKLLLRSGLRHMRCRPWQPLLSILGVALGVAVVVGVDLANQSASDSFASSMEAVTGRASHQITGGAFGFPESVYLRVRRDAGARPCAPIVEGDAAAGAGTVHILGVDPFAEAAFRPFDGAVSGTAPERLLTESGAVLATEDTARALHLGVTGGDAKLLVNGVARRVHLAGGLKPSSGYDRLSLENLLIADISTAQELLGMEGKLSRIDLLNPDEAKVRAVLPPGLRLETAGARTEAQAELTRGFQLNLTALSFLALIVGTFLIYNTITFSVVQRREAIGVMRGLGVTRRELFALVLAEALVVATIGTAVGLVLGAALGQGLIGMVTRTINDFYFVLSVQKLRLAPVSLAKGVALGMGATLFSALVPAYEASSVPPRTAWIRSLAEDRLRQWAPWAMAAGALLMLLAGGLTLVPSRSVWYGLFSLLFMTVGFAMWVPGIMLIVDPFARAVLGRTTGILGRLAAGGVTQSMSRTVVAIAALMVSVAVVIGIGSMVRSFRRTVGSWLGTHLPADVYIAPPSLISGRPATTFDAGLPEAFSSTPGIERVVRFRNMRAEAQVGEQYQPFWLVACDRDASLRRAFPLKVGDPITAWSAFDQGDILISEPLSLRFGLKIGSQLTIATDRGPKAFRVAAIFYDYASDQGAAIIARPEFERLWDDRGVSSMGVFVKPDADLKAVVAELKSKAVGRQEVFVRPTGELRAASLEVFDRTFAITSVLRLLAMIVSFIGVLSALMALQLERDREFAVLRANGLTPGQLGALVTAQTSMMGLTAGLLALPLGWAITALLIEVINKRSFNWSIQMFMDPSAVFQGIGLALAAAALAGVYPAWKMASTSPARALRSES